MGKVKLKKSSMFSKFLSRFLVFIVLTLVCLISLKSSSLLRSFVYKNVFQNNLKFAKINEVYEKYFGSSLPFINNDNLSLVSSEKLNYEKASKYKDGVKLFVSKNYAVPILKSGIVVFAGEKEGYGNTVIVEDSSGVQTWYSNLDSVKVSMYDYLKKGSIVGEPKDDQFILVFTKDGKVLSYKKYI